MDIAIDINDFLNEKLVNANELKDKINKTISVNQKRFICSQCGEYVAYVFSKDNKMKAHFKHGKYGECDLRANSGIYQSVDDKLGLNLYIKKNNKNFDLFIGFNKIESDVFSGLINSKANIEVIGSNKDIFEVNNQNFIEGEKNYEKLSNISSKYMLKFNPENIKSTLEKKFGNNVTGIRNNIGLFTFNETGGRLIRINEEVETNTEYYLIKRTENINFKKDSIEINEVGNLNLKNEFFTYNVSKINFKPKDRQAYKELSIWLREVLKVKLVEKSSQLITLWPATIKSDIEEFYYENKEYIFSKFETYVGNSSLSIHFNNELKHNYGLKINSNSFINKLKLEEYKIGISFNENDYLISKIYDKKNDISLGSEKIIEFFDINDNEISYGECTRLPVKNKIKIKSNLSCEVIQLKSNGRIKRININKDIFFYIDDISFGDEIFINGAGFGEYNLYFNKITENNKFDDEKLYLKLKKSSGPLIKNNLIIKYIISNISKKTKIYNIIRGYMIEGAFPQGAYKYLKEIERGLIRNA